MQQEKKLPILPADDAVQNWFEENIDKECSASSAVYKFRLWLESLQREYQVKRQQAIGLGLIEDNPHPSGCEWVKDDNKKPEIGWSGKVRTVNTMGELNERKGTWFPGWEVIGGNSDEYVSEWLSESPSKEGNKEREIAFADYCKRLPYSRAMFTTAELWNEWNNQQKG